MDEKLRELADRLGIATAYTDCGLKAACHEVSDETVRFFAGVLGYKAGSGEEIARSAAGRRRWNPFTLFPEAARFLTSWSPKTKSKAISAFPSSAGRQAKSRRFPLSSLPCRKGGRSAKKRTAGWKLRLPPIWRSVITTPN